jgi:hypothetical protein
VNISFSYFNFQPTWKNLSILTLTAFLIRGIIFFTYVQHAERYRQADSMDYHACALSMGLSKGMYHINTQKPIFWRVPGYPLYLSWFYRWFGITHAQFEKNAPAQKAAIWFQIVLCSFIPLMAFFLALLLTNSLSIAWIAAWIFVFHLGFILASCYLLTDALAMVFFFLFLLCFYASFNIKGELKLKPAYMFLYTIFAALNLAIYTWLRPNGEFIALLAAIILLLCKCSWQRKFFKITIFLLTFFACISPWYIRNHNLTGKWFFCPMSGPYHLAFSAPKILRRVAQKPLDQCIKFLCYQAKQETDKQEEIFKTIAPHRIVCKELVCSNIAYPWLVKYPHYFVCDWLREVCKTTFDLYSSQLVAFVSNSYTFDPIEEFLEEKIKLCIYKQQMPIFMRMICFLELLFSLLLWFGLLGGFFLFMCAELVKKIRNKSYLDQTTLLWIKTGLMIGGLLFMTGGFGYARLRLPAEALMIILSLTFWDWFFEKQKETKEWKDSMRHGVVAT